jgi:hypothetical protein
MEGILFVKIAVDDPCLFPVYPRLAVYKFAGLAAAPWVWKGSIPPISRERLIRW